MQLCKILGAAVLCMTAWGCDDGGDGDAGGPTGGDAATGGSCPTIAPTAATGQNVAIVAVSLTENTIRLRNVSGDELDLADWQVCFGPGEYAAIAGPKLGAGEDLTLALGSGGSGDDIKITSLPALPTADELGIYNSDSFGDAMALEAYVRYSRGRQEGESSARETVALDHEPALWTEGDEIQMAASDDGFVATGSTVGAAGFTATSQDCL